MIVAFYKVMWMINWYDLHQYDSFWCILLYHFIAALDVAGHIDMKLSRKLQLFKKESRYIYFMKNYILISILFKYLHFDSKLLKNYQELHFCSNNFESVPCFSSPLFPSLLFLTIHFFFPFPYLTLINFFPLIISFE